MIFILKYECINENDEIEIKHCKKCILLSFLTLPVDKKCIINFKIIDFLATTNSLINVCPVI